MSFKVRRVVSSWYVCNDCGYTVASKRRIYKCEHCEGKMEEYSEDQI